MEENVALTPNSKYANAGAVDNALDRALTSLQPNHDANPTAHETRFTSKQDTLSAQQIQNINDVPNKENQLIAGSNINIDRSNPQAPVISSTGGGGGVTEQFVHDEIAKHNTSVTAHAGVVRSINELTPDENGNITLTDVPMEVF